MPENAKTIEQIRKTISVAKDSVWVVESEIQKLTEGESPNKEIKDNIERNVAHINIVLGDPEITGSGEDISSLQNAVTIGQAKLTEIIWPE